jgi:hypothetical protein
MMVPYSEATATTAGTSACTPVSIAMRKLCLSKTGWGILNPLERERLPYVLRVRFRGDMITLHYQPSLLIARPESIKSYFRPCWLIRRASKQ